MGKARIATGVLLVTLVTAAMGYTIASAVLSYQDLGFGAEIDFAYIAQNYLAILDRRPDDAQLIHLIIGSFAAAGRGGRCRVRSGQDRGSLWSLSAAAGRA